MPEWLLAPIEAMNSGSGSPWAIVASALLAFTAVFITGAINRKTARLSLTFQNQSSLLWDEDYIEARKIFIKFRDGAKADRLGLAQDAAQSSEEATAVRTIMNDYELVAIGIREKILDERFLRTFSRKTFIDDYEKMQDFITEIRRIRSNNAIFLEFETLACRWRDQAPNGRPWWNIKKR